MDFLLSILAEIFATASDNKEPKSQVGPIIGLICCTSLAAIGSYRIFTGHNTNWVIWAGTAFFAIGALVCIRQFLQRRR